VHKLSRRYLPYERAPTTTIVPLPHATIFISGRNPDDLANVTLRQWIADVFESLGEAQARTSFDRRKVVLACVASPPAMSFAKDKSGNDLYRLTSGKEVQLILALGHTLNFRYTSI
jgi:hypothetical protein